MTSTLSATSSAARAGSRSSFPLGISVFDHEVATLDVTEVTQSLTEGLVQVGIRGRVGPQPAYSSDLGRRLGLGGERCDDDAASEHRHEGAPLHHWVLAQVFCESGARGCGAWGNRAGSMQEPSLQAGRSVAERRCQPVAQSSAAVAHHPDSLAFDAGIQRTAATVLLKEGDEVIEQSAHSRPMVALSLAVRQRLLL